MIAQGTTDFNLRNGCRSVWTTFSAFPRKKAYTTLFRLFFAALRRVEFSHLLHFDISQKFLTLQSLYTRRNKLNSIITKTTAEKKKVKFTNKVVSRYDVSNHSSRKKLSAIWELQHHKWKWNVWVAKMCKQFKYFISSTNIAESFKKLIHEMVCF